MSTPIQGNPLLSTGFAVSFAVKGDGKKAGCELFPRGLRTKKKRLTLTFADPRREVKKAKRTREKVGSSSKNAVYSSMATVKWPDPSSGTGMVSTANSKPLS